MAVEIRFAQDADTETLVRFGKALHAESPRYTTRDFSEEKLRDTIAKFQGDINSNAVTLVAERNGELLGVLAGAIVPDWFGMNSIACDLTFYVPPEHRGGRAALLLLRHFETWARMRGAAVACLGISTQIKAESTLGFYEKMGYELVGHTLSKDL